MKMFLGMFLLCILLGSTGNAQQAYISGGLYVIDATGMPSGSFKTAAEISASKIGGRVRRHQSHEGNGTNPSVNNKVSPLFAVAPAHITAAGAATTSVVSMNWLTAASWGSDANGNNNATATAANTGCYMYRGPSNTDAYGTWRLPTLRELNLIWVLHERLKSLGMTSFSALAYHTASEYFTSYGGWYVDFADGKGGNGHSKDYNGSITILTRCVKDL